MTSESEKPQAAPDPSKIDPAKLRDAHGRTGQILKQAGLPFEEDEFDGESARDSEAAAKEAGADADADDDSSSRSSSDDCSSTSSSSEEE